MGDGEGARPIVIERGSDTGVEGLPKRRRFERERLVKRRIRRSPYKDFVFKLRY